MSYDMKRSNDQMDIRKAYTALCLRTFEDTWSPNFVLQASLEALNAKRHSCRQFECSAVPEPGNIQSACFVGENILLGNYDSRLLGDLPRPARALSTYVQHL